MIPTDVYSAFPGRIWQRIAAAAACYPQGNPRQTAFSLRRVGSAAGQVCAIFVRRLSVHIEPWARSALCRKNGARLSLLRIKQSGPVLRRRRCTFTESMIKHPTMRTATQGSDDTAPNSSLSPDRSPVLTIQPQTHSVR